METQFLDLLEYELYDDGVHSPVPSLLVLIHAEENYNNDHDEKWLLWIAKALYKKQLYYRCCLCLEECSSTEAL